MLNEPTRQKLHSLKLSALASEWERQQRATELAKPSFDERMGTLVVPSGCTGRTRARRAACAKRSYS